MKNSTIGLGALCLLVTAAGAQDTNTVNRADKDFVGGEIVVTAARVQPIETISTTRGLTGEELERRGARNVTEALRTMPGIYTRIANDGTERVDIRGFRTRHVNLMLNGVPLNSTYDGQFDASLIPVENISKIKVGYGNQSVLYGSGGLGGVINVVTKIGEPGAHGSGEVEVGEGDRYVGRATLSRTSEKVSVFVGASHAERDHFNLSDDFEPTAVEDGGERENSDYERDNVLGSVSVKLGSDWVVGGVVNYMRGEFGKPPNVDKPKYVRVEDYEGLGGQLTLNRVVEEGTSVRAALFHNQLNELENSYDDGGYSSMTNKNTYSQDSTSSTCGGNLRIGRPFWEGFNATAATGLKCETFMADGQGLDKKSKAYLIDTDESLYIGMLGVEAEQKLFEKWIVLGGYSQNWMRKDDGENDTTPSYMLGTTYDLFDSTILHASYAHQIRFPSIKQLYDADGGNPNLNTESSDNYELGATQWLGDQTELDVTAFVRDVDDFIEKDVNDVNQNFEQYLFHGVEATLDSQLTDSLNTYVSYTYLQTENRATSKSLQYRPEHVAQLGGEWAALKYLLLYGNVRYVAGQYSDAVEQNELDDYVLVDLRATIAAWDRLRVYIGVDNVFDENYAQSVGVPREGRSFYVGAKAIF